MQSNIHNSKSKARELVDKSMINQNPLSQLAKHDFFNPEILIGISSSLLTAELGDGESRRDDKILQSFDKHFVLRSCSAETEFNLFGERQSEGLLERNSELSSVGVKEDAVGDDTEGLKQQCRDFQARLSGYIFESDLSSNRISDIKGDKNNNTQSVVNDIIASQLKFDFPLVPIEKRQRLTDPELKKNFIQRVCVMHRWQRLANEDRSIFPLIRFHKRHYHVYLSHDSEKAFELKSLLSLQNRLSIDDLYTLYIQTAMDALNSIPSCDNHSFVLRYLLNVLESYLSRDEHQEINQSIERYQSSDESIKIPLTMLRYQAGKHSLPELVNSVYLFPYPQESMFDEQNEVAIAI